MKKYLKYLPIILTMFIYACYPTSKTRSFINENKFFVGVGVGKSRIDFIDSNKLIYASYNEIGDDITLFGNYTIDNSKITILLFDTVSSKSVDSPNCSIVKSSQKINDSIQISCLILMKQENNVINDPYCEVSINHKNTKQIINGMQEFSIPYQKVINLEFYNPLGLHYELTLLPYFDYEIKVVYDYNWLLFMRNKVEKITLKYKHGKLFYNKYFYIPQEIKS